MQWQQLMFGILSTHCFDRYPSCSHFQSYFFWHAWVSKTCVLIEEVVLRHSLEWFRPIRLADSRPGLITGLVSPYGAAPPNHAFWTCSVRAQEMLNPSSRDARHFFCQARFLRKWGEMTKWQKFLRKMTEISTKRQKMSKISAFTKAHQMPGNFSWGLWSALYLDLNVLDKVGTFPCHRFIRVLTRWFIYQKYKYLRAS